MKFVKPSILLALVTLSFVGASNIVFANLEDDRIAAEELAAAKAKMGEGGDDLWAGFKKLVGGTEKVIQGGADAAASGGRYCEKGGSDGNCKKDT